VAAAARIIGMIAVAALVRDEARERGLIVCAHTISFVCLSFAWGFVAAPSQTLRGKSRACYAVLRKKQEATMKPVFLSSLTAASVLCAMHAGLAIGSDTDAATQGSRASSAIVGQNCIAGKNAFSVADDMMQTMSASFVLMPGMRRVVTTSAPGCVIVEFAGELASANTDSRPQLRAVAHNIATAEPASVRAGFPAPGNEGAFELRAMRFVFASLPAGTYDFRIEWRSEGGQTVSVQARTLTIQYR